MLSEQEHWSYRQRLLFRIQEQINIDTLPILSGSCQSFEEYKNRAGRLAAFSDVLAMDKQVVAAVTGLDRSEI